MASPHGTSKKRHVLWDGDNREDTHTDHKRVCTGPSSGRMGLDPPSDLKNIGDVGPSTMFPYVQSVGASSKPFESLIALPSTQFTAEQNFHDPAYLLPNDGQGLGAGHSPDGYESPRVFCVSFFQDKGRTNASLSYRFSDAVLEAQTLGNETGTLAVMDPSQYNNQSLSLDFTTHAAMDTSQCNGQSLSLDSTTYVQQIQQGDDFEDDWGIDHFNMTTHNWANPAASLSFHSGSGPQGWLQHSAFVQYQSAETSCFPVNFENAQAETCIKAGTSTEQTCLENQVHPVDSGMVPNIKVEIGDQSSTTSDSIDMALDSSNLREPSTLRGVSSPSSICSSDINLGDKALGTESITELPHNCQYDTCFGVVSH